MAQPSGTEKTCAICSEDCSNKPRTKDKKGRYYCRTCYDEAAQMRRVDNDVPAGIGLALESIAVASAPTACPSCGRAMTGGAVLCTACGYNVAEGFRLPPPSALKGAIKSSAPWFMSPVYLYFRPATFFHNFVNAAPLLIALFAWIFGMAGVADRIDTKMFQSQMSGRTSPIYDSWAACWVLMAIGGMFAGALYYAIGGWWYRVRVRWCGAADPDAKLVRRVYILASLVYAVPAIVLKAIDTVRFPTPEAAAAGGMGVLEGLVLLTVVWSVWTSFVGVRTVFKTSLVASIIWFLVLPMVVYGIVIVGVVAAFFIGGLSLPPDIAQPQMFRSNSVSFSYPGNWVIDTSAGHDPNAAIVLSSPMGDALVEIYIYETNDTLEVEADATVQGIQQILLNFQSTPIVPRWGPYEGVSRAMTGSSEGEDLYVKVFVSKLNNGKNLEVIETVAVRFREKTEPGFKLIRSTFSAR